MLQISDVDQFRDRIEIMPVAEGQIKCYPERNEGKSPCFSDRIAEAQDSGLR
jgi:hypothetical protein